MRMNSTVGTVLRFYILPFLWVLGCTTQQHFIQDLSDSDALEQDSETVPETDADVDGDSDGDADTETDMDTGSDVDSCGGARAGGHCWYLGDVGQSCHTVCETHGGYDPATKSYAGSDGSATNCAYVLSALGAGSGRTADGTNTSGIGCCIYDLIDRWRITAPATYDTAWVADHQRACACNE